MSVFLIYNCTFIVILTYLSAIKTAFPLLRVSNDRLRIIMMIVYVYVYKMKSVLHPCDIKIDFEIFFKPFLFYEILKRFDYLVHVIRSFIVDIWICDQDWNSRMKIHFSIKGFFV